MTHSDNHSASRLEAAVTALDQYMHEQFDESWQLDLLQGAVAVVAEALGSPGATLPPSKPEWATLDPRWLVKHLREHTQFDADAVAEMIAFAQAAARREARSLVCEGADDE
jgi:hypothetical protein